MTGQKIEQAMELLMGIADDTAKMADKISALEKQIAGFQALYEINKYMSRNLDLSTVISALEDIVVGVLGMNCRVLLNEDIAKNVTVSDEKGSFVGTNISFADMESEGVKELFIADLSGTPRFGLKEGSLISIKMGSAFKTYGYLVAYNNRPNTALAEKQNFFSMLVIQLCIYIENALLVQQLKERISI